MVLAASIASLGMSAGGVVVLGSDLPARLVDIMSAVGVLSAFVTICAAEARFGS